MNSVRNRSFWVWSTTVVGVDERKAITGWLLVAATDCPATKWLCTVAEVTGAPPESTWVAKLRTALNGGFHPPALLSTLAGPTRATDNVGSSTLSPSR